MAKKQTMNLVESHIEKVILVLAIGFFGWVVFTRFVSPSALSTDGGPSFRKISKLAEKGSTKAQEILVSMKRNDNRTVPAIELGAEQFGKIETRKLAFKAFAPYTPIMGGIKPVEKRQYNIPIIPPPTTPKIILTHARAYKPLEIDDLDALSTTGMRFTPQRDMIEADVDFVTVEVVFPFAQIRDMFRLNFTGPQVEKPLELYEPIFADVELLRSRFLPDQTWSDWEKVERLEVDQMHEQSPPENMSEISLTSFDLLLKHRMDPSVQRLILQPQPYQLMDAEWLPPTKMAEQKEQEKKDLRAARASGARDLYSRRTASTRRTPRNRPPPRRSAASSQDFGLEEDDEGSSSVPLGRGGRPPARPGAFRSWSTDNQGIFELKEWLEQEEIIIWANDAQVEPGGTYRYLLRVGIFNPIAGRDWFSSKDRWLKNQPILWSPHISPDKIVTIPERTLFFPKIAGRPEDRIVTIEVCRWVEGLWHKKDFRVTPGSIIGTMDKKSKTPSTSVGISVPEDEFEVDYSTNVTVLDIVANSSHWYRFGSSRASFRNLITTDIIYLDTDGLVKRLGVDKRSWPEELDKKRRKIIKAIREQNNSFLTSR